MNKKFVLIFSTNLSKIFFILRRIQRDIVTNVQGGARNVMPLIVQVTHFYYYKNI